jgi:hypothetical protein
MSRVTWSGGRIYLVGLTVALVLLSGVALCACGQGSGAASTATTAAPATSGPSTPTTAPPDTTTPSEPDAPGTSAPVPSTSATDASPDATVETIVLDPPVSKEDVFARIAEAVKPLPIFAPTSVPDGAELAPRWLPVLESKAPVPGSVSRANPFIVGTGADAEVQVVYQVGAASAWLVVIENFHGDLGDVSGTDAGKVDGIPARLYEVNGGELVQWSLDGRWYGVFGRGVSKDVILAAALGMVQASAESL